MPHGNITRNLNNEGNMSGTLTIQPTAGSGVSDVLVNGESVVRDHKAHVNIEVEQTVTEGQKIASIEVNGNNTYILIPEIKIYDDATGDLISTSDAMQAPAVELSVTLEPQQAGTGDPSPDNVRPISGWDEVDVVDDAVYGGNVNWNQIVNDFNTPSRTIQGITRTFVTDGEKKGVKISGTATATDSYTVAFAFNTTSHKYFVTLGNVTLPTGCALNGSGDKATSIISNGAVPQIYIRITANTSINVTVYPQVVDLTQLFGETKANEIYAMEQAEAGSGVAYFKSLFYKDYYPYNSGEITNVSAVNGDTDKYSTYNIQLGSTCYGGELDVKSGVLKVTDGYIASYNGETLPSTWISDRDVYAPNTSPTTGAEVVYKLATPQEIQLTPTEVTLLRGINNIWSDGEVYAKWRVDVEMLLQSIIDNR